MEGFKAAEGFLGPEFVRNRVSLGWVSAKGNLLSQVKFASESCTNTGAPSMPGRAELLNGVVLSLALNLHAHSVPVHPEPLVLPASQEPGSTAGLF